MMKWRDFILLFFCGTLIWCLSFELLMLKNNDEILSSVQSFNASLDLKNFFNKSPLLQERLFLIDRKLLQLYIKPPQVGARARDCVFCNMKKYEPITFALLCPSNPTLEQQLLLPVLRAWEIGFWIETIVSSKPKKFSSHRTSLPLGFILQKGNGAIVIEIILLYEREGDFWWHGSLQDDVDYKSKLMNLEIPHVQNNLVLHHEGALDKFQVKLVNIDGNNVNVPNDIRLFLKQSTDFVECNYDIAHKYHSTYGKDTTMLALKFNHRARKLLSQVKYILDEMDVPFWISSGTLLGYYRQCDVIPYSRDVDIGIFRKDYKSQIVEKFRRAKLRLMHTFGRLDDGFELTFFSETTKLDIFLFYDDGINYWNGAHLLKTNRTPIVAEKFKYSFTKFTLCWTEFLDMKIRIPCETENYIRANYGPNWFVPSRVWNFVESPYNVEKVGEWTQKEIHDFFKHSDPFLSVRSTK